jgi:hypothetical protein
MFYRHGAMLLAAAFLGNLFCESGAFAQDVAWTPVFAHHGEAAGQTTITVAFPESVSRAPLTFGIPLGQVASPGPIALLDDAGKSIPADFVPLGNWEAQPAHWTLVSCVVDGQQGDERRFTLRWGEDAPPPGTPLRMRVSGTRVEIENTGYAMTVTPTGIQTMTVTGEALPLNGPWAPTLIPKGGDTLRPEGGLVEVLRDGPVRKQIRFVSALSDAVELHQEFTFCADSPYVRCDVRFVNRSTEDVPVDGIVPVQAGLEGGTNARTGLEGGESLAAEVFTITQKAFGWRIESGDGVVQEGTEDALGEWVALRSGSGASVMAVFPFFQEMAAGDDDVASVLSFDNGKLRLAHYLPLAPSADVRLRETMARTFTYWLAFDPPRESEAAMARAVKAMPHVVYDRQFLTDMGVFQEECVSHLFDAEVLEAALYYDRARVPRPEFIRSSRGADPGPDKSGEGFYEVDLHAGGMVFGEVFQYFTPEPDEGMLNRYQGELGIPKEHILTGGICTYRNGDIVLGLYQQYLRSGNRTLHDLARIHGQVFADVSVSHAPASKGLGHYYCDWYCNPYVYQRFEGLLLGALVTGDPWWFETAKDMAVYCVRAWKDGEPRDGGLHGGLHGVQYRSAYIGKMLLKMYQVTGDQRYADTAARLAEWIMPRQEPDGWWRDTPSATREYRCSPIFAGYTSMGLWPLYWSTHNDDLKTTLLKSADFFRAKQEDVNGHNPGTFPNSYWYANSKTSKDTPIEGNYATSSHWANILLNAYLATDNPDYFYSANAAWLGVVNHQTPEGGVPLSNSFMSCVWSHVMVESLPAFAALAEGRKLPIVLSSKTGVPGTSFMGRGATYTDGVFTLQLKYKHGQPLPVRVFFPAGKPSAVTVDGEAIDFTWDDSRSVVSLDLLTTKEYRAVTVRIEAA